MHRIVFNASSELPEVTITLPSSKSISNRLLILKYIHPDIPEIINISNSEDTQILIKALESLKAGKTEIDVEDCGTAMRFLIPILAATPGKYILKGSSRMHERPVNDLVDGLRQIGAEIFYLGQEGFPPLMISGKKVSGGQIVMDGSISSQFISALMMASSLMEQKLEVFLHTGLTSIPYIQMTGELMLQCSIPKEKFDIYMSETLIQKFGIETLIPNITYDKVSHIKVEPDWSSASYIYAICACLPGSKIFIPGLSLESVQGDVMVSKLFESFGVSSVSKAGGVYICHTGEVNSYFEFNGMHQPDLIPALATTAAFMRIPSRLSGLDNLVYKESNRLQALFEEINSLFPGGCQKNKGELYIDTRNIIQIQNHIIDTRGDHRLAMAFSIGACKFPIQLSDISVVRKSFPGYWDELMKLGFETFQED